MTLRKIIKEEIQKLLIEERKYYTVNDAKKIYKELGKFIKNLPRVRLTDKPKTIKLKDGTEITFSFNLGIFSIRNWDGIPNFQKIVVMLKKYFGDVHTAKNDYINARDFGEKYKEYAKITPPKNIKALPKIKKSDFKSLTTKNVRERIIGPLRKMKDNREAKIDTKNIELKLPVVYKSGPQYKILKHGKDLYVTDSLNLYYVKNVNEGKEFINLCKLYDNIMQDLMVKSWDVTKMGPANAFD